VTTTPVEQSLKRAHVGIGDRYAKTPVLWVLRDVLGVSYVFASEFEKGT
jgi:hypothetical protein